MRRTRLSSSGASCFDARRVRNRRGMTSGGREGVREIDFDFVISLLLNFISSRELDLFFKFKIDFISGIGR